MTGVKLSLNLNIGEMSFKSESNRKDDKRNFSHNKVNDIKLSLNEEINEISFTLEGLNDIIQNAVKQVVERSKEVAEPVVEPDDKLDFCRDFIEGSIRPRSDKEYKNALKRYFQYTSEELDNLQHSPEALLRMKCVQYLKSIKKQANPEDAKLQFCKQYLEDRKMILGKEEMKSKLERYFNYDTNNYYNLDALADIELELILKRECKNYLVKKINTK